MQRIYKRHWRLTNSSQTTAKANEMVVEILWIKDKWNCQSHCSKKNKQWVTSSTWVGTLCESCEFPRIRVTGGSGLGGRCLLASVADGSGFCWLLSLSLHIWVFFRKKIRVHNPRLVILVKQLSREKRMKQIVTINLTSNLCRTSCRIQKCVRLRCQWKWMLHDGSIPF